MSPPRRVASCAWAPLLLLASCACWEALAAPAEPAPAPPPARRGYCERADPAWRAYLAPIAFEGRVQALVSEGDEEFATMRVRRVLRHEAHWPRRDAVLRLRLAARPAGCSSRFEVLEPLKTKRNYIVFAERRGAAAAAALGPPLRRSRKLMRRIGAVYEPGYSRAARVQWLRPTRVAAAAGTRVRLECAASARPPPRITWYKDRRPLIARDAPRRIRVTHYRRKSVLEIRHARRADSGRYECRALGAVGPPATAAANVSIGAPHHPPPTDDTSAWGAPCPMPDPGEYCLNGGTCLFFEQVREPACKCPEGFNGQRCENKDVTNRSSMYHSYTCKLGLSTSFYC